MIRLDVLEFNQPGGVFYLGVMPVKNLLRIFTTNARKYEDNKLVDADGVQRESSPKKVAEIKDYSLNFDATFPTPIILAIRSDDVELDGTSLTFVHSDKVAEVIDGQHRLLGLEKAFYKDPDSVSEIQLPVVFIFDAEPEQKALIFATINGKQTKVSSSLIADLYGVSSVRNPRKTAHEIARALNSSPLSPWQNRLKMLGKRTSKDKIESLSQGTFVRELLPKISSDPDDDMQYGKKNLPFPAREGAIFNDFFRQNEDEVILKILMNIFTAVKETWPDEWEKPDEFILTKTAGYEAIMGALDKIINHGESLGKLNKDFFMDHFHSVKVILDREGQQLTSEYFKSQRGDIKRLTDYFLAPLA
jgi:DGQHR domain-containing protein